MKPKIGQQNSDQIIIAEKLQQWSAPELIDLSLQSTKGGKDSIGTDEQTYCCGPGGWGDKLVRSPS